MSDDFTTRKAPNRYNHFTKTKKSDDESEDDAPLIIPAKTSSSDWYVVKSSQNSTRSTTCFSPDARITVQEIEQVVTESCLARIQNRSARFSDKRKKQIHITTISMELQSIEQQPKKSSRYTNQENKMRGQHSIWTILDQNDMINHNQYDQIMNHFILVLQSPRI